MLIRQGSPPLGLQATAMRRIVHRQPSYRPQADVDSPNVSKRGERIRHAELIPSLETSRELRDANELLHLQLGVCNGQSGREAHSMLRSLFRGL